MTRDPDAPSSAARDTTAQRDATATKDDGQVREVAASLSHDLNNPLTWIYSGIDFALEALAAGDLAQARTDLAQAREGADRVHAVVRRLEAYAATGDRRALRPRVPPESPAAAAPVGGSAGKSRLLVIDDEPTLIELVEQALASTHVVVACRSPRAALSLVRAGERFDAVLCDLAMPELDGLSVHAELRRIAPDLAARCVLMSGGATSARAHAQLAAHEGPRLKKPFGMRALREAIRAVSGGSG